MNDLTTDYDRTINHIGEISKNARSSWFGLLGVLVFATLAVSNVQDSDFFAFGVKTTLPVVNVEVPTVPFFWIAPVLVLSVYIYLHLYLTNLWHALGMLPEKILIKGEIVRPEDSVYPWILSDAALYLKPNSDRRFLSGVKLVTSLFLIWIAGPIVLGLFWARSWPYHNEWLSIFIASVVLLAVILGICTILNAISSLSGRRIISYRANKMIGIIVFIAVVGVPLAVISWNKTEGPLGGVAIVDLYRADLRGAELVPRPESWTPWDISRNELLSDFGASNRFQIKEQLEAARNGNSQFGWISDAKLEFVDHRKSLIGSIGRTNLTGADLRNADLSGAFISGADLSNARIGGAKFDGAEMEGVNLSNVDASFSGCLMVEITPELHVSDCVSFASANLAHAKFQSSQLRNASFLGSNLSYAHLSGNFEGSVFSLADLEGAILDGRFVDTFFFDSDVSGAELLGDFSNANFVGVDLRQSNFVGSIDHAEFDPDMAILNGTSFVSSNLRGAFLPSLDSIGSLRGSYLGEVSFYIPYLATEALTDTNLSDLDLSQVEFDKGGLIWAVGNEFTRLPISVPPIKLLKCFAGIAPESYYIYGSYVLPIGPTLFKKEHFCDGEFGNTSPENLILGPSPNSSTK